MIDALRRHWPEYLMEAALLLLAIVCIWLGIRYSRPSR